MSGEALQRREYVEAQEQKAEWVNVGEPPITGLLEKGRPERKETCEDVKINDPTHGLFLVADGVSLASGWFASREAARMVNEDLGGALDTKIEAISEKDDLSIGRKKELIDSFIKTEMKATVLHANEQIHTQAKLDQNLKKAATTISLAKWIEFPDKTQYLYLTNVGDSRLFVVRNRKLIRLSQDDNFLMDAVKSGSLSSEKAYEADQANSIDQVPEEAKFFYQHRARLSRAVGVLEDETVEVNRFQVFPGDRLLILSDGVTNQLKEDEILRRLVASSDDRMTERDLQQTADHMAQRGTDPRAKADDISAIVFTVPKRGRQEAVVHKQEIKDDKGFSPEVVAQWRAQISVVQRQLLEQKIKDSPEAKSLRDQLARLVYWVARIDLQHIQENTPRRFQEGDSVVFDSTSWNVVGYDTDEDAYLIRHPSKPQPMRVERFQLELGQTGDLVLQEDKIKLESHDGNGKHAYTVVGEDGGMLVLMRTLPEGIERRLEKSSDIERALREQLLRGQTAKKHMQQAEKQLLDKVS